MSSQLYLERLNYKKKRISKIFENKIESTLGTYSLSATSYNKKTQQSTEKFQKLESEAITLPCYRGLVQKLLLKK